MRKSVESQRRAVQIAVVLGDPAFPISNLTHLSCFRSFGKSFQSPSKGRYQDRFLEARFGYDSSGQSFLNSKKPLVFINPEGGSSMFCGHCLSCCFLRF